MSITPFVVIAPHFKWRRSGITTVVIQLVPKMVEVGRAIVTLGPGLPAQLPRISWFQVLALWRTPRGHAARIWHARRNNEMLFGVILKNVLRMKLKLVFTSSAQRNHRKFTRWLMSQMDAVISTSTRSGSYLQVPYVLIPHGVNPTQFDPPQNTCEMLAEGCPSGKYLAVNVGRVRYQKGTDLFVKAMVQLLPNFPEWSAVICGRVTLGNIKFAKELIKKVDDAGLSTRIRFLGEVDDMRHWYRLATLCVAPSRTEGFGLTPLEAMASMTAVVASDAGSYPEMIVPDVTGAITPAGNYESLFDAISNYLADPELAQRHGENARRHVIRNFSLEKEAVATDLLYQKLLEPRFSYRSLPKSPEYHLLSAGPK
jgi:mannosyltransferase